MALCASRSDISASLSWTAPVEPSSNGLSSSFFPQFDRFSSAFAPSFAPSSSSALVPQQQQPQESFFPFLGNETSLGHCIEESDDDWLGEADEDVDMDDFERMSSSYLTILDLPMELVSKIFSYLPPKSFCAASGVCMEWRSIASSPCLWKKRCDVAWAHLMAVTVRSSNICSRITMPSALYDKKFSPRIKLLVETLGELNDTVQARLNPKCETHHRVDSYYMMTNILLSQMYDSNAILSKIESNPLAITENFDMIDLTLRRYMHQINSMFPLETAGQPQQPPSHLIKDRDARALWEKFVGKDAYYADFTWFYDQVLIPTFPELRYDHRFRNAFQFFVNFPCDDMLTTYKW